MFANTAYEAALARALSQSIKRGDCVWDVGANIGHYTVKFSAQVGPRGSVYAFEPERQNLVQLRQAVSDKANVTCLDVALSDANAEAVFMRGGDALGATSRIVLAGQPAGDAACRVATATANSLVARGRVRVPNVVKIDVEGHEYAVLSGMRALLGDPHLSDIFVEVHFANLSEFRVAGGAGRDRKASAQQGFRYALGRPIAFARQPRPPTRMMRRLPTRIAIQARHRNADR